ncbi:MAG: glycosyltransferase family 4 protein [Actinomycetia bacterium]|nr:glycosyltransferase family 4 protein [Actinomycetes bacterium]
MKVGIAKPEWGITGGFETHLDRLIAHLRREGHQVQMLTTPARSPDSVDALTRAQHPSFFDYVGLVHRFEQLDARDVDVVVTTQPGSWAIDHPNKLALFYHHERIFYDLAERYQGVSGIDADVHTEACLLVRELDSRHFGTISHFLVPSETVTNRLVEFSGIDRSRMSLYLACANAEPRTAATQRRDRVLCVSRNEFTKRTQLFVAAAHEGFNASATLIGGGGQLPTVRRYAAELSSGVPVEPAPWDAQPASERVEVTVPDDPVQILGRVDDDVLAENYSRAICVVAPAYDEDYGLTVLEAFAFGTPVVVCSDGGGLVEFVEHGHDGFVVDPEPDAIADAVCSIVDDPELARRMGAAALQSHSRYTWDQAYLRFSEAVEIVASGARTA